MEALSSATLYNKILGILTAISMMLEVALSIIIRKILKKTPTNSVVNHVIDNIYSVHGHLGSIENEMAIIKGIDGSLFLWNVREPQVHTLAEIMEMGPVKYICVPSLIHDGFAKQWKQHFPAAKVITAENEKSGVSEAVEVDTTFEQEATLGQIYGLVAVHDSSDFSRTKEKMLEFRTLGSGKLVLFACDVCGNVPLKYSIHSILAWINGLVGLRVFRSFRLTFITDTKGFLDWLITLSKGKDMIFFAHGPPLMNTQQLNNFAKSIKASF